MKSNELITNIEASALTGLSLDTIRVYKCSDPQFPKVATKIGNANLYRRADVLAWKARREAGKHTCRTIERKQRP